MRTTRRFVTITVATGVAAAVVLGPAPAAIAKGPTEVRVEGPGMAPMDLAVGMHGEAAPEFPALLEAVQVFSLGARELCRLAVAPSGELGPRYRLSWNIPSIAGQLGTSQARLSQDFYPDAPGGPLTYAGRSRTWIRAMPGVSFWWHEIMTHASAARPGPVARDSVVISGPGFKAVDTVDRSPESSPHVRFIDESGLSMTLFSGASTCRVADAPTRDLGPGYTFTWTMDDMDWGVQDVYPFAAGGPVVYDHQSPLNSAATGGWFRAGEALLAVWPKLGLPTESQARAAASPPAPAVAPVAATRPATADAESPGTAAWPWLLLLGVAVLAAGSWAGVRWRRHGQLIPDRDNPPGKPG